MYLSVFCVCKGFLDQCELNSFPTRGSSDLGSFCLTVCLYPGVSEFVFGRLSLSVRVGEWVWVWVWVAFGWRPEAYFDASGIVHEKTCVERRSVCRRQSCACGVRCVCGTAELFV